MKKLIKTLLINGSLAACIIYSSFMGVEWAGNLAMFVTWLIIFLVFISCFMDASKHECEKSQYGSQYLFILPLAAMAACGWFVTAAFYCVAVFIMKVKLMESK